MLEVMSTQEDRSTQLNRLITFRQSLYAYGLMQARAAQFELVDALLLGGPPNSFVELSLTPVFRRRWSSVYAALRDGRQDASWFEHYCWGRTPADAVLVAALDETAWPHPTAHTLEDLQYVHSPSGALNGRPVVVGHSYSILAWVPTPGQSWAMPLALERVASPSSASATGVSQVQRLLTWRHTVRPAQRVVVVADAKYGNQHFLRPLRQITGLVVVTRLRRDHVLFGPPGPYTGHGRRIRKHGARFAFKDPSTWGPPADEATLEDPAWGQVRLRCWHDLHLEGAADTPFTVVLAEVHRERCEPPAPLWLAGIGAAEARVTQIWQWYQYRWPIEPATRFRKQTLGWTCPHLQDAAACDRWTLLVSCAYWQLFLARELVVDKPLPWQPPQARLTPARVRQSLGPLFPLLGTPVAAPQTRGIAPGWPKGQPRQRPATFPVVKKTPAKPGKAAAMT
jgi:hypothetical protein